MPPPPDSSTQTHQPRTPSPEHDQGEDEVQHYWDFCPNCGSRLHNVGCKYRCLTCHYFMSCSDFD